VQHLSPQQRKLVSSLTEQLGAIPGVKAVVLGGSHARGRALPESDIDLYIFYSEATPFSIEGIRDLAERVDDNPKPVVTDFYGWGPWVNGGAWLTIDGQRVDFVYRSLEHVERVITEAEAGQYELDYTQQPPFGFFSPAYLGEIAVCYPLFDPEDRLDVLKRRIAKYPDSLRSAVVQDYLWQAELALTAFAPKFVKRSDPYGVGACLTRAVNQIILVLFALNRRYFIDDKTAPGEIAEFEHAPKEFTLRVQETLARPGKSPEELGAALKMVSQLFAETDELTGGTYEPRFLLPK